MTSSIPISLSKPSVNSVEDRQQRTFDREMTTSKYKVTRWLLALGVTKLVALLGIYNHIWVCEHYDYPLYYQAQLKPDWKGPILGARMSELQTYDFTPEQLAEAKNTVNTMQYGSNSGASQAGMSMGKQRMIND